MCLGPQLGSRPKIHPALPGACGWGVGAGCLLPPAEGWGALPWDENLDQKEQQGGSAGRIPRATGVGWGSGNAVTHLLSIKSSTPFLAFRRPPAAHRGPALASRPPSSSWLPSLFGGEGAPTPPVTKAGW